MSPKTKKLRQQFYLSSDLVESLDKIKSDFGFATRAETVRYAINIFEWVLAEIADGNEVGMKKKEGKFEPVTLPLARLVELRRQAKLQKAASDI